MPNLRGEEGYRVEVRYFGIRRMYSFSRHHRTFAGLEEYDNTENFFYSKLPQAKGKRTSLRTDFANRQNVNRKHPDYDPDEKHEIVITIYKAEWVPIDVP